MSNNYLGPDDSTQSIGPAPQSYPAPQGKLVLGSGDAYQTPEPNLQRSRRPYQYPGEPAPAPITPPDRFGQYGQSRVAPPPPVQPGMSPQAGQSAGRPARRPKGSRWRKVRTIGCLVPLAILLVLGIVLGVTVPRVLAFGSTISTKAPLSTETNFMNTSDRTNLLIMGYGGGNHDGANLTDSLVVTSMIPSTSHTSLVSVPRDLWVQNPLYPSGSGNYTKINAIYEYVSNNGTASLRAKGAEVVAQKVSAVTGLNVQYWMMIDFTGFQKLIDSIGGVDVYVPDSFNACYPNNDDATKDASWKVVQFNKGQQHMNGTTAIEYARAREPMEVCSDVPSENLAELTDFGRSARQQIIVKAALSKIQQIGTWPRLFDAMDALKDTVYTNMSLLDLGLFARKMNLSDPKTAHIGLSNQNVLEDSNADDGGYILIPQNNDWDAVAQYVKSHLYQ